MNRLARRGAPAAAGLVLGVGAVLLTGGVTSAAEQRAEQYAVTSDRVQAAIDGLRDDHVHVPPDGRPMLSEADEEVVSDRITERDLPVYVVVWEPSWAAGYDHPIHAAEQIAWALGEDTGGPVAVVLWEGAGEGHLEATPGALWRPDVDYEAQQPEYLGEAGLRLPEWVDGLPDGESFSPLEESGAVSGVLSGLFAGLAVVLGVAVLAVGGRHVLGRVRAPGGPTAAGKGGARER